jgi:hypothetical protein
VAGVDFLSADWVERYRAACATLPERPGASARIQTVVTGGAGGSVGWWVTFADGRATAAGIGGDDTLAADLEAGTVDGVPLVSVTLPLNVAESVADGRSDLSTAFMQGRAKVAGDQGALLRILAMTATPEYRSAAAALEDATRR